MQSQINYDNLEANRELIQLSIRFARLSDRKKRGIAHPCRKRLPYQQRNRGSYD